MEGYVVLGVYSNYQTGVVDYETKVATTKKTAVRIFRELVQQDISFYAAEKAFDDEYKLFYNSENVDECSYYRSPNDEISIEISIRPVVFE